MGNQRLRNAMHKAQVTGGVIASETGVHEKTVDRWLNGRLPHPRHRYVIADLVGEPSYVLWPEADVPITGADTTDEIVCAWPHRADAPLDRWSTLLAKGARRIDLLGYAIQFLPEQHPRLRAILEDKARQGCVVRIALADPASPLVEQRDHEEQLDQGGLAARIRTTLRHLRGLEDCPGVEIGFHCTPMYNSVFRFDDEMLVTPHLYGVPGYNAPLMHLRRLGTDGLFDGFAHHFETVWSITQPIAAVHA